jgi:hypothetical protein
MHVRSCSYCPKLKSKAGACGPASFPILHVGFAIEPIQDNSLLLTLDKEPSPAQGSLQGLNRVKAIQIVLWTELVGVCLAIVDGGTFAMHDGKLNVVAPVLLQIQFKALSLKLDELRLVLLWALLSIDDLGKTLHIWFFLNSLLKRADWLILMTVMTAVTVVTAST